MTTIAWDGVSIAADRLAVGQDGIKRPTRKLYDVGGYIFAGAGNQDEVVILSEWLAEGALSSARPTLDGEPGGLAIDYRGRAWIISGKHPVLQLLETPFWAVGSGREYAIVAMHLGRNAQQAVEIAATYDLWTGLGVDVVDLSDRMAAPARGTGT